MSFWQFLNQNMCVIFIGVAVIVAVVGEYWGRSD
jgi:hypothetical protein